jgi:two-component system, response regulator
VNKEKYILLVEDNPDDVALTELALKKNRINNRLVIAWDGEAALDYLFGCGKFASRDTVDEPALILLDLKLPFINGLEVLKQIRTNKRTCYLPVIVLTSSLEDKDQAESCRLGANRKLRKPTGLTQFMEIIRQISKEWLDNNEHPSGQ